MDRDINFLLNRYYYKDKHTERLAPGELWSTDHAVKNMKDQRTYERFNKMETIINERITKSRGTFQFPRQQKDRARHLIRTLDFTGRNTEEEYIVMIIVYVKMEANPNRELRDYQSILNDYGIGIATYVKFLVRLNKHHINELGWKDC